MARGGVVYWYCDFFRDRVFIFSPDGAGLWLGVARILFARSGEVVTWRS